MRNLFLILGSLLFVIGVLILLTTYPATQDITAGAGLWGCLLIPGGILVGYIGGRMAKGKS